MYSFWGGFEKRAYDYAHEARQEENYNKARSKETPMDKDKAKRTGTIAGGAIGGIGGGIAGAMHGMGKGQKLKGGLIGGGAGLLLGGLLGRGMGYLSAMADKLGIEEAQKIMAMPARERTEYLKAEARAGEISDREAAEWSRHWSQQSQSANQHQEMMGAMGR